MANHEEENKAKSSRRNFLKQSSVALVGGAVASRFTGLPAVRAAGSDVIKVGLIGCGGAMGGIALGEIVGYLLDHGFGYAIVFRIAGSLHLIAFLLIQLAIPTISPLSFEQKLTYEGVR